MPTLIIYGVLALTALGIIGGIGYKVRQSGYDSCKVEWSEETEAQRQREQQASAKAADELEKARNERKVVIQTRTKYVDKLVDRPVYRNQCVDSDGLRCLNAAIDGKDTAGCKPDGTMPAVKPPG